MKKIIFTILLLFLSGCDNPLISDFGVIDKIDNEYNDSVEIKEKYDLIGDKALKTKKAHKDDLSVKIGDESANEFIPNLTIDKWDDEVKFKLKIEDINKTALYKNHDNGKKDFNLKGKKIKYKEDRIEIEFYEIEPNKEHPEGAYEIEMILLEKPDTNVIEIPFESENLKFIYQPPLTQEEINEGYNRPENVIGSYAVYHSTKKNHIVGQKNYKIGKAFHIYRPKIIDSNNWEVWGDLHIENGIQQITIPQDFIDNAVYPIIHAVGETFGRATIGGSNFTVGAAAPPIGLINGPESGEYTAETGDIITKYSVYAKLPDAGSETIGMAAYTIVSNLPNTRLGTEQTITINSTSDQWWDTGVLSISMTNGVTYNVAEGNYSGNITLYYDSGTGNNRSLHDTAGALPVTWVNNGLSTAHWSQYATYTPVPPLSAVIILFN